MKIALGKYQKNRINFLNFHKVELSMKMESILLHYDDMFRYKLINDAANAMINRNLDMFVDECVEQITRGMERKITKIANEILETAPYDEFFPDT